MLLKADDAEEALNITENKTNSVTDISWNIVEIFAASTFVFLEMFSWIYLKRNSLIALNCLFQKNVRSVRFRVPWE